MLFLLPLQDETSEVRSEIPQQSTICCPESLIAPVMCCVVFSNLVLQEASAMRANFTGCSPSKVSVSRISEGGKWSGLLTLAKHFTANCSGAE